MMNPYLDEIARLRARVAELESELAARDARFDQQIEALVRNLGVTVGHARMLAALATGHVQTREHLARQCGYLESGNWRNVDSSIKRLRRMNIPGLTIRSIYGAGYLLEGESLALVRAAMKPRCVSRMNDKSLCASQEAVP